MIRRPTALLTVVTCLGLSACVPSPADPNSDDAIPEQKSVTTKDVAAPEGCWARHVSPAVVESVTEQVLTRPAKMAPDGKALEPAEYRTETRQAIIEERQDKLFETPCKDVMTSGFIASLQRALAARGLIDGPANGKMDARTIAAVRRYQSPRGLDSGTLSLQSAREMGLIAIPIEN